MLGSPIAKTYAVGPNRRFNIWVDADDPRLAETDVSAVITSDLPIIVERAMYLNANGQLFGAGHESAGITAPATQWFLAEGATGDFFDLFVPGRQPVADGRAGQATFLLPDGSSIREALPRSREHTLQYLGGRRRPSAWRIRLFPRSSQRPTVSRSSSNGRCGGQGPRRPPGRRRTIRQD